MLTELLEKRNAIVLSDFDRTIIKQNSILNQLSANFKRLNMRGKIKFMERLLDVCARYKMCGLEGLYSLFEGCPVEVLD